MTDLRGGLRPASRRRQAGAVALLFLVTLVVTVGSLLAGIDLARLQLAQARLQASLDAAVDSALQRFGPDPGRPEADWQEVIEPWLLSMYPASGFAQSTLTGTIPEIDINPDRLVAEVNGQINLVSAGLLDIATADLLARRVVPFQSVGTEVVLAIDVSILSESGPDPVRDAATALVTQLVQSGSRVAIVPFSDTANIDGIDPGGDDWLDPSWKEKPWFDSVWKGCVSEIGIDEPIPSAFISWPGTQNTLAPMAALVQQTLEIPFEWGEALEQPQDLHENVYPSEGPAEINETLSPEILDAVAAFNFDDESATFDLTLILPAPDNCLPSNVIHPLDDNISNLTQLIDDLQPDPVSSQIPVGLLWSWRILNNAALDAGSTQPRRALVLLSGGENLPATPQEEVTTLLGELNINVTLPPTWCPGLKNNKNKQYPEDCESLPPGQASSTPNIIVTTEPIEVTVSVARREVTSLNTDGPEVAVNKFQTNVSDLNAYTTTICDNLRMGMGDEEIELHALTFGTPPDAGVVADCVGESDPQRNRQFNASNWATIVNETVADLTSAP